MNIYLYYHHLERIIMASNFIDLPSNAVIFSGLGALGVALQNYPAVELFIKGFIQPNNVVSLGLIKMTALGTGGLCSGMVNFWMNVELLEGFFARMTSDEEYVYKQLSLLEQVQYFGGIGIFVVTGALFGLMAFTFAMEGPFAMLSIVAGIFVAGIMTVQEVETWLSSYDKKELESIEALTEGQQWGKLCGHVIAIGNVIALSLLFTLSLAQSLIALNVAASTALLIGFVVAFTFGAFTEYYFYDFYLSDFLKDFGDKCEQMTAIPNASFGLLCIATNAFVNAALTYTGVEMLAGLVMTAGIALPPVGVVVAVCALSGAFAGAASFLLGMAFWIGQHQPDRVHNALVVPLDDEALRLPVGVGKHRNSLFAPEDKLQIPKNSDELHDFELGYTAA
jgi:hypothetical protein